MARYVPLSKDGHGHKTWKRPENYRFARQEHAVALMAQEAGGAACEMPIGFLRIDAVFELVAVLSLKPGENFYVAPDGKWLMRYIPAVLRGHPFRLVRQQGTDQMVLCVDEESECYGTGDELFFDAGEAPSKAVQAAFKFHTSLETARIGTALAVAALAEAGIIVPWNIKLRFGEKEQPLTGLYRIDQDVLDRLDDAAFLKLRKVGALGIAYSQLVSAHQLSTLKRLGEMQERLRASPASPLTPNQIAEIFRQDDQTLIF